jgi:hypothetical protein
MVGLLFRATEITDSIENGGVESVHDAAGTPLDREVLDNRPGEPSRTLLHHVNVGFDIGLNRWGAVDTLQDTERHPAGRRGREDRDEGRALDSRNDS